MLNAPSHKNPIKPSIALVASLVLAFSAQAKGGGTAPEANAPTNWLAALLVFTAVVLLFVIWGLGQVLLTFAKQLQDKRRTGILPTVILLFLGLAGSAGARAQDAGAAVSDTSNYGGLSPLEFYALATVIGMEVLIIFFRSPKFVEFSLQNKRLER